MAKKFNKFLIVLVFAAILFITNLKLFTIFIPKGPVEITDYINKYYFPINEKSINSERCTTPEVTIGTSFAWDVNKIYSSNYFLYKNQYYKVSRTTGLLKGDCTKIEGTQILINDQAPFKNFIFIQKGANYILCQNLDNNNYKYSQFNPIKVTAKTNRYYIKYSLPQLEPEGKYYCDEKTKTIYRTPCGSKAKEVIEFCQLGCEKSSAEIDNGEIQIVKCKGEYKPNITLCSNDGKLLYQVDQQGLLTIKSCCSCSNGKCSQTVGCKPADKGCVLLEGGNNSINIFLVDADNNYNHSMWIMDFLPTQVPYNEFTYNIYNEKSRGSCTPFTKETSKDIRISWEATNFPCGGVFACAMYSYSKTTAGNLWFNKPKYASITKSFLLLHELGHVYLRFSHTCDRSIMDADGGIGNRYAYPLYQVEIIRKNLNDTNFYSLPKGTRSC